MNKESRAEAVTFQKNLISEAMEALKVVGVPIEEEVSLKEYAEAYGAMIRLRERFGYDAVTVIYSWLCSFELPPTHGGSSLKKRLGKEVFDFFKRQSVVHPAQPLKFYREKYELYIHPEVCGERDEPGQFYLDGKTLLVTRLMNDGIARVFPQVGHLQLYTSYSGALEAKKLYLSDIIAHQSQVLAETEKELSIVRGESGC